MPKTAEVPIDQRAALRPAEAAAFIGVGLTTFYSLLKSGAVPCKRLGGATIVTVDALKAYVKNLPSAR